MKLVKLIIFLFFLTFLNCFAVSNYGVYSYQDNKIDAVKNAREHNALGNIYFQEKNYIAALREYEIAYNLSYQNNLSATYLYNIARCYMTLGRYETAKNALLGVIRKDCMNITYYDSLVDCFIKLKTDKKELKNYLKDSINPYNKIVAGLIYMKTGNKRAAKTLFDEFITNNPDMLITSDIKRILKKL